MARNKKAEDPRSVREKQKEFLAAWAVTFSVSRAAELAKVSRDAHYDWFRKDKRYAAAFERRQELAGHYLETTGIERAGEGWLETVYYQGEPIGEVRRFDSGLMQFLLRGMMPDKYRERTVTEHTGSITLVERLTAARQRLIAMKRDDDDDASKPTGTD